MRRKKRAFEIFNLSFLDVISCGFGAVVLLVLISNYSENLSSADAAATQSLLEEVLALEAAVDTLSVQAEMAGENQASKHTLLETLQAKTEELNAVMGREVTRVERLQADLDGLVLAENSLKRASIRPTGAEVRDEEVGGIPVDSDYVVFIVDTSGSMLEIWPRVVKALVNVIDIHPKVKGFQVLNDNGAHLISGYAGRWITDTPKMRANVIKLLKTWKSASNSSPVEGLQVALRKYVAPSRSVSIYIFGDEYSGGSYDPVIKTLYDLNTNRVNGRRMAKVHAVGFLSDYSDERFPVLMREVTRQNGGTFLALPR